MREDNLPGALQGIVGRLIDHEGQDLLLGHIRLLLLLLLLAGSPRHLGSVVSTETGKFKILTHFL